MSISTGTPQITALKMAVEKVLGTPVRTHDGFLALVGKIERTLNEHISESTLERMWGYSTRDASAISLRTLDVLSKFVGSLSWDDYCKTLKEKAALESEELTRGSIFTSNLAVGSIVRLGWLPDRIIEVEYLGNTEFTVKSSLHSSLQPGDRFKCLQFQKGEPLFLDCFLRDGEDREHRYVVGEHNGLTMVEVVE